MDKKLDVLKTLDIIVAFLMYAVSTAFSISLFVKLGPNSIVGQTLFTIFALSFEMAKIVLWIYGVSKNSIVFIILAISMSIGSLVCSAVALISEQDDRNVSSSLAYTLATLEEEKYRGEVESLEREVAVTEDRLTRGVGVAEDNRRRIDELRMQISQQRQLQNEAMSKRIQASFDKNDSNATSNPLETLANTIGAKPDTFRLAYTGSLSLLLELAGLATSYVYAKSMNRNQSKRRFIILPSGVSHVAVDENGKAVCGGTFKGTTSDKPSEKVCEICTRRLIDGNYTL